MHSAQSPAQVQIAEVSSDGVRFVCRGRLARPFSANQRAALVRGVAD